MSDMPERIWAWRFMPTAKDLDIMAGGWSEEYDRREVEYIRADKVAALVEAARRAREYIVSGDDRAGPVQRQLDAALAALDAKP